METATSPNELPQGRARRDLLHDLHIPLQVDDLSAAEKVDLVAGLQRLREAVLACRGSAA